MIHRLGSVPLIRVSGSEVREGAEGRSSVAGGGHHCYSLAILIQRWLITCLTGGGEGEWSLGLGSSQILEMLGVFTANKVES